MSGFPAAPDGAAPEAAAPEAAAWVPEDGAVDWKAFRARGLAAFKDARYTEALVAFGEALAALCPVIDGDGDALEGAGLAEVPAYEAWTLRSAAELCSCAAAAALRQRDHLAAAAWAGRANDAAPLWSKPLVQLAKARFGCGHFDKALNACDIALQLENATDAERADVARLRRTIEKRAYGAVVTTAAPAPPRGPPRQSAPCRRLALDAAKDVLAEMVSRCCEADALDLLRATQGVHADLERAMVSLQCDVLVDYGYARGGESVADFGAECRRLFSAHQDRELYDLVDELRRVALPFADAPSADAAPRSAA
ncbi:hypothetical protein M885DRAFT_506318 [Pelagophyceae sp. CCMP2097]|nr:hypothetical protein M885DRAFT_506318 [Pelagophyceae sp. CCMP2097]